MRDAAVTGGRRRRRVVAGRAWRGAAVVLSLVASGCGQDGGPAPAPTVLAATPLRPDDAPDPTRTTDGADGSATGTAPAVPTPDASPTPPASAAPVVPTDTARARFVAGYRPAGSTDLDAVAADLDGDGVQEVVVTSVRDGRSRLAIAAWTGRRYEVVGQAVGGPAERLRDRRLGDVNGDGAVEAVVLEGNGRGGSLTVWRIDDPPRPVPLVAQGGCWSGSATYGVIGAELRAGPDGRFEIVASCDDRPLPVRAWRTQVYRWVDGAYRPHDPDPVPPEPSPGPTAPAPTPQPTSPAPTSPSPEPTDPSPSPTATT